MLEHNQVMILVNLLYICIIVFVVYFESFLLLVIKSNYVPFQYIMIRVN